MNTLYIFNFSTKIDCSLKGNMNYRFQKFVYFCSQTSLICPMNKTLFILDDYDAFFEQFHFYGIKANIKTSKLLWLLKTYINQSFTRNPEKDVEMYIIPENPQINEGLFAEIEEDKEPVYEQIRHPLVELHFPSSQKLGYIYQNKVLKSILLPSRKDIDFILASPMSKKDSDDFQDKISKIPEIQHIFHFDIFKIKEKENLLI